MKKLYFIFLFIVIFIEISAQSKRKYVNEFAYVGVGARQFGMGKTGVASTTDAFANYWNPASLVDCKDNMQLGFMHNFYFQNLASFDFLGLAFKGNNNMVIGGSFLRFGVDKIPNTLDLIRNGEINYNNITEFSAADYVFSGNVAQEVYIITMPSVRFSWGATAKIVHRRVGTMARSWGFGLDASARLKEINGKWALAATLRDVSTTFNNWSFSFTNAQKDILFLTENELPVTSLELALPRLDMGGYYKFESGNLFVAPEINLNLTTDGKRNTLIKTPVFSIDPRIGAEAGLKTKSGQELFFRTGLYNFQSQLNSKNKKRLTLQPSFGIGYSNKTISIDYAIAGIGNAGTGLFSNIVSARFSINKEQKK